MTRSILTRMMDVVSGLLAFAFEPSFIKICLVIATLVMAGRIVNMGLGAG